jgi:hypothetical protein
MAFAAINEEIVTYQSPEPAADRTTPWFKFPRAGTVKNLYLASSGGVATANTTVAFAPSLLNGGTAGTSTLTVATFGSIATPYIQTAALGYSATFDNTALKDFTEGQWAVVREDVTGAPTTGVVSVSAHVVLGTARVS